MERKMLVATVSLVVASAAHGQSSVTLFGVIDEGLMIQSNARTTAATAATPGIGSRRVFLDSIAGQLGSRWGLRGVEDLGGGTKAVVMLESGVNLNSGALGQAGLLFGRQAYVGFSNDHYGTVTFGRQYESMVTYFATMIAAGQFATGFYAQAADVNNVNASQRVNNAVKYASPNLNGLTFGGTYSLGGVPGSLGRNSIYSAGVNYARGPIVLAAAYLFVHQPNTALFSNSGLASGLLSPGGSQVAAANTIWGGYATAATYQTFAVGSIYKIGDVGIGVNYSNTQFRDLQSPSSGLSISALGPQGTAIFNVGELNAVWHVTPAFQLGAAYTYAHGSQVSRSALRSFGGATYNSATLGADYFLSKATDVYVVGIIQKAHGTDSTGNPAVANIANLTPSSNDRQAVMRIGLRVKF
ncbi:porin [Paraburkholderia silvatlantica]|uniref:Porin n=1 Tax=Paraburkholderia silvatlantica TaxID=321895 RepID=A0ABR6FX67_9BURK|nr:porin [Paraburkholderia silvatlantica]MBB2931973.1 putative porin [Paraburkholderia silvatlantica]